MATEEMDTETAAPAADAGEAKGPMTFQDLDDNLPPEPPTKSDESADEKKPDEGAGDAPDDDADDDIDLDDELEGDEDLEEEVDGEEESDADETQSEEGEGSDKEPDQKAKADLKDDQTIEFKVDGKREKITVKEAKQLLSSGMHLKRAREQFNAEVQRHHQDFSQSYEKLQAADQIITPISNLIAKGDIEGAIIETAKFKKMNKLEARRTLIKQMIPAVARRLGLSDQEVSDRLRTNAEKNNHLDLQEEVAFNREEKKQPPQEVNEDNNSQRDILAFQKTHGVSDNELHSAINYLKNNIDPAKVQNLTLDQVKSTVLLTRIVDKSFNAIRSVRPNLQTDQKFVDRVIAVAKKKPDWGVDRLARWVEKQARQRVQTQKTAEAETKKGEVAKLQKDLGRKVLKSNSNTALKKTSDSSQKKPLMFRDLEDGESAFG